MGYSRSGKWKRREDDEEGGVCGDDDVVVVVYVGNDWALGKGKWRALAFAL